MASKFKNEQDYTWFKTLEANGRYPLIANRIFDTYIDASNFLNSVTVIPGIAVNVINDPDETKNGMYVINGSLGPNESAPSLSLDKIAYESEISGHVTVTVSGNGNAVTTATSSGNTLTIIKGSTFSYSNHGHTIYNANNSSCGIEQDGYEYSVLSNLNTTEPDIESITDSAALYHDSLKINPHLSSIREGLSLNEFGSGEGEMRVYYLQGSDKEAIYEETGKYYSYYSDEYYDYIPYKLINIELYYDTPGGVFAGILTDGEILPSTSAYGGRVVFNANFDVTNEPTGNIFYFSYNFDDVSTKSIGIASHAEGINTYALNAGAHAEGYMSTANGNYSHAEGINTQARVFGSHAEGMSLNGFPYYEGSITVEKLQDPIYIESTEKYYNYYTPNYIPKGAFNVKLYTDQAYNDYTYNIISETYQIFDETLEQYILLFNVITEADSGASAIEPDIYYFEIGDTYNSEYSFGARETASHTEGSGCSAAGAASHAEGIETQTTNMGEHAEGRYNKSTPFVQDDTFGTIHSIGIGTSNDNRLNAVEVIADGRIFVKALGGYDGTNANSAMSLQDVIQDISGGGGGGPSTDENVKQQAPVTSNPTNVYPVLTAHDANKTAGESTNYVYYQPTLKINPTKQSVAEGNSTTASGYQSHAEGSYTVATEHASHAEGWNTAAGGSESHAEGAYTKASGNQSHAEGGGNVAYGTMSHAEGYGTTSFLSVVATNLYQTTCSLATAGPILNGDIHIGSIIRYDSKYAKVTNIYNNDLLELDRSLSSATLSSVSIYYGDSGIAYGDYSHIEGCENIATNNYEHAQGSFNISESGTIHSIGIGTSSNNRMNAVQIQNDGNVYIYGLGGYNGTTSVNVSSLQDVFNNITDNKVEQNLSDNNEDCAVLTCNNSNLSDSTVSTVLYQPALRVNSIKSTVIEGYSDNQANGYYSHVEGYNNQANGYASHAEGMSSTASGAYSHVEGAYSQSVGAYSHAEGQKTQANGQASHAEGINTYAGINFEFLAIWITERYNNEPNKVYVDVSITGTLSIGDAILINNNIYTISGIIDDKGDTIIVFNENISDNDILWASRHKMRRIINTATGNYSHASGIGTIADKDAMFVVGKYNSNNACRLGNDYLFVVGNGENDTDSSVSNAFAVLPNGITANTLHLAGGKTQMDMAGGKILFGSSTQSYIENDSDRHISLYAQNGVTIESPNSNINLLTGENYVVNVTTYINASDGFYQSSDIRKKDIKGELDVNKCYEFIEKCTPMIYTWKNDDREQIGMIAQEVQEFFPEIISTDKDGYLSLDYAKLTVIILRVLKDMLDKQKTGN